MAKRVAKVKGTVQDPNKGTGVVLSDGTVVFEPNRDVIEDVYSSFAEWMQTGDVTNNSHIGKLIKVDLNSVFKGVQKDPQLALSAIREAQRIAKDTNDFYVSKKEMDADLAEYTIRKGLFPWQTKVFDSSDKRKTLLAGRRAGKTYCTADLAIKHCLVPCKKKRQAAIIGLTFERCAALYWQNIKDALKTAHITPQHIDNGACKITFSNGNTLELRGNNSKAEREKMRGADFSFVAIDECQSQGALRYLYNDILAPQLKGTDGDIVLLGTAPLSAGTFWEQVCQDPAWAHFHATMEDNPSIPDYANALQSVLEENHWTKDNVTFRREYLGEICYDINRLVFPFRTYYDDIPDDFKPHSAMIGIDFGFTDSTAIASIVTDGKDYYLFKEWKQTQADVSTIVNATRDVINETKKRFPTLSNVSAVADSSNGNVISEIYNRGIIEIRNAYKVDKDYQIKTLKEGLSSGHLKIKKNDELDLECDSTVWKFDDERGNVVYDIDDAVFHPDMVDAVRYAYNELLSMENL